MMIKNALEYIVGLGEAKVQEIRGEVYSDKPLHRIDDYFPKASRFEMSTLSSLVDYIKAGVDDMPGRMVVHVASPEKVILFSQLDPNREREHLVEVNARVPAFPFDRFIDHETFCINVQSKFLDDPETDKGLLLKFAGTVEQGSVAQYGDDGVTQKATVRTGIATKTDAVVPNPVKLRPYRTFIEVEQPVSEFIFRMKQDKNYDGVSCAVFEADGGAWKNAAMKNIKQHLEYELAAMEQFIVIA